MMRYRANLAPDHEAGGYVVTFPDVPEAITQGDDVPDALRHAVAALETALMIYMDQGRELPRPSRFRKKDYVVTLPALSEAKSALYQAMRESKLSRSHLARRLQRPKSYVDRLLDLRHPSRLDQMETALAALHKRLVVQVANAA